MKNEYQDHKKYKHLYVIVRLNSTISSADPTRINLDSFVNVIKAYDNPAECENEIKRLNELDKTDEEQYFMRTVKYMDSIK